VRVRALLACLFVLLGACAEQQHRSSPSDDLQGAPAAIAALGSLPENDAPADAVDERGCLPEKDPSQAAVPARDLLALIDRYAAENRPGVAKSDTWFKLYDRYRALAPEAARSVDDRRTAQSLSILSLVAVLPDPAQWAELRAQAYRRAQARRGDADEVVSTLAVVLLFDALANDLAAQTHTLDRLDGALSYASNARQEQARPIVTEWRRHLAIEAGQYDPAAELWRRIDARSPSEDCCFYLDALVRDLGDAAAERFLRKALFERNIEFAFSSEDGTLAMAQRIVLAEPARLARVQWRLAEGARALEALRAMSTLECERRSCRDGASDVEHMLALAPRNIRGALVQPLIEAGADADAGRILAEASESQMAAYSLTDALRKMLNEDRGERALDFMRVFLRQQSSTPYWSALDAFAFATDQRFAVRAYALLDQAPSTAPDLESTRAALLRSIAGADPASNDAPTAAERLQRQLQMPVATTISADHFDDPRVERADAAMQLAELGWLERREDWLQQGLAATSEILAGTRAAAYAAETYQGSYTRDRALDKFVRLSIESGRSGQAERMLLDEFAAIGAGCRTTDRADCAAQFASRYSGADRDEAARLLMLVYAHAHRDADVRMLADRYPLWKGGDLAELSFSTGCDCDDLHPAAALARALISAGDRPAAIDLLRGVLGKPFAAKPDVAQLYGRTAGPIAIDDLLGDYRLPRGMRLAVAAMAANGAGEHARAADLAAMARRETLYEPWRSALVDVSADAAQVAGDAAARRRWQTSKRANDVAARASRYDGLGISSTSQALFDRALTDAQPGDCIETRMLDLARRRGERAEAAALLRRVATNARDDRSGAAIGCLRGFLSLQPEEYAVLRPALTAAPAPVSDHLAELLPAILYALDGDCDLSTSVDRSRVCVDAAERRRDARSAYASLQQRLRRDPGDVDTLAEIGSFVERSDFGSLYAGHMDHGPGRPALDVAAAERDTWTIRRVARDPWAIADGIRRIGSDGGSAWSSMVHLLEYRNAAFAGASIARPAQRSPAYPLAASVAYQRIPETGAAPPLTAADRANDMVAGSEIVIMAARLIEPGVHDPCTMCL